MNTKNITIINATNAIKVEILHVLKRQNFPVTSLKLLTSTHSINKTLKFKNKPYKIEELKANTFKDINITFFSANTTHSHEFVPATKATNCVMVNNSSTFHMDPNTPLVVPKINKTNLAKHNSIIANPNYTAAILSVTMWPIHKATNVKRIIVSTYQSTSNTNTTAIQKLENQTRDFSTNKEIKRTMFPHQITFNVFSHNTKVTENGYNEKENKVIKETRKMFHLPKLPIAPTYIRIPVLRAHSEAITLKLNKPLSPKKTRAILTKAPNVKIVDDTTTNHFPIPLEANGDLNVHVNHIRHDLSNPNGLML